MTVAPTRPESVLTGTDTEYAQRRKQHLALINQLRAIGAQTELDLPRVAVIGNQSAGKSSLVEAISGINVPRDAGTCTRCPMECRLASSSEAWTCQVSIRWEFDKHGRPQEKVTEQKFGMPLKDKAELELVLRRAQAAVLNPKAQPNKFANISAEMLRNMPNELAFSRNAVCLDISGPELTDLAFVDLPGIIQNASLETVQLVENLVKSNIKGNCLILVTLPMSDDIENQKAMQLAKEVDPVGLRTIGVMTKPDTLPSGATKARDLWLDVIEGRRFPLKHGYYCTRQPDDDERSKGITNAQAREAEMAFFRDHIPWRSSTQKQRFGTSQLVTNLSKLLTQIIYDTMPKLRNEATSQLGTCLQRLKELPPAVTTEPTSYVLSLVTNLCRDVALHVDGDPNAASLVQQNRRTYAVFKRDIRGSAPPFVAVPSLSPGRSAVSKYADADSDDDGEELQDVVDLTKMEIEEEPQYITLQDVRKHIRKSLGKELPGNVPYGAKVSLIQEFQRPWELDSKTCFHEVANAFEGTLLKLIQRRFERYQELRSHVQQSIKTLLDSQAETAWQKVKDILDREKTPFTQNKHYFQVSKSKYLSYYKKAREDEDEIVELPPLKRRKTDASEPSAVIIKSAATNNGEGRSPTPARPLANGLQPKFQGLPTPQPSFGASTSSVPQKRRLEMDDEERKRHEMQALASLTYLLGRSVDLEDLSKLLPPDVYEEELEVMAEVRAYFKVAYKRVIDDVPMAIDDKFLAVFRDRLQDFLLEKLGIGGPNSTARCAGYLAEDPTVVAEREELTSKKNRLEAVQSELLNFGLAS